MEQAIRNDRSDIEELAFLNCSSRATIGDVPILLNTTLLRNRDLGKHGNTG